MRRVFSFLLTALLVSGVAACHHKHQTNKLARPPLSANNNNLRNNLNNIGRRKRQTFGNTGLGLGGSNLPNTGVRNPGVTNTNTRPDEGYGLEPWSKLYWPLWFDCHKHRATGRLAFQVCRKQFAQTGYMGGFALTWLETRTCIEDYAYVDHGYGDPDETSFQTWDLDRNGQVTYEEWWEVEGGHHQGLC